MSPIAAASTPPGPRTSLEQCREALEAAGIKATQQRLAILQALWAENPLDQLMAPDSLGQASHAHPQGHSTAEDLFRELRPAYPSLSLGTVYRTLDSLVAAGIIRKLPGALDGPARFDADTRPHHHLVDPDQGVLRDLHDAELDALLADYFRRHPIPGFVARQIQLTVIGSTTPTSAPA